MNECLVDYKSRKFLENILGKNLYVELVENGKIEFEIDGNTYVLDSSANVINKTTNERYCIVADRPDYPKFDLVAIKYAWLKYQNKVAESIANKSRIDRIFGMGREFNSYDEFVHAMGVDGWYREPLRIHENNTTLVNTYLVTVGNTGRVVDVVCPVGRLITTKGIEQLSPDSDRNIAHNLSLRLFNDDGTVLPVVSKQKMELNERVKIKIEKIIPSDEVIIIARDFYSMFKTEYYWRRGIVLYGGEYLRISVINPNIMVNCVEFEMDLDLFTRR